MSLIAAFPGTARTSLAEVGGKALSLIRLIEAGFPVPPGAVLTAAFFEPWFAEIQASVAWQALSEAEPAGWPPLCQDLKAMCPALQLTADQRQALDDLRADLAALGHGMLFAVRSSSPEEDLASASFAGGYETRLGVLPDDLETAVRHCFASSLDERVLAYKKEHGFDALSPRIAVIVQQQIDCDVAGVAFSLNPLTNDYDEAVIDASWGLGESVVAGLASPDHFVIDKISGQIVEHTLGAKQVSIHMDADGGTVERHDYRSTEPTLTDTQLGEITDVLIRIEDEFGIPMDVEWGYAGGQLNVLQARPITTYVPLPPEMLTRPGERRRLYVDASLSKGLTINAPMSPLGLEWMADEYTGLISTFVGPIPRDVPPEDAVMIYAGGRMYMNFSNMLWLQSPKTLAKGTVASDVLMSEIVGNVDRDQYRATSRPPWVSIKILWIVPRMLWRLRGFFGNTLSALVTPERAQRAYQREVERYERRWDEGIDYTIPLDEFRRVYVSDTTRSLFFVLLPPLIAAMTGLALVDLLAGKGSDGDEDLAERMKLGFTGNVVVEMGIALYRLAKLLDRSDFDDADGLKERIETRRMPDAFLREWDAFMRTHGCRGPMEMDLARPRYADDAGLPIRQMSFMSVDDGFDPGAAHERRVEERLQAYETLMSRSGWLRRSLLRHVHRIIDLFAGTRDTPKHSLVLASHAVRKRVLIEGRRLVEAGRLDAAEDIFDLSFPEIESAGEDPTLDLRARRAERRRFLDVAEAQVTEFPHVIDSRGRILRPPPRPEAPGELTGMAASPGVVTGPVKVLRSPHDKDIETGDVLVAYTTDPGWTPLFVNAAAIVLEVGGILQHGAVVAREFGKPCVAGIDRLMTKLHDGQQVEVDGTSGVVRILP